MAKLSLRIFLDANILFSAAYRQDAGLCTLWRLKGVHLLTSLYAVQEAASNLTDEDQQERLKHLLKSVEIVTVEVQGTVPAQIILPDKDRPILAAAIQARVAFLLTGDVKHFGIYFGHTICGVRVERPAEFLKLAAKGF